MSPVKHEQLPGLRVRVLSVNVAVFGQRLSSREKSSRHRPTQAFRLDPVRPTLGSPSVIAGARQDTDPIAGNLHTSLLPVESTRVEVHGERENAADQAPKLTLRQRSGAPSCNPFWILCHEGFHLVANQSSTPCGLRRKQRATEGILPYQLRRTVCRFHLQEINSGMAPALDKGDWLHETAAVPSLSTAMLITDTGSFGCPLPCLSEAQGGRLVRTT